MEHGSQNIISGNPAQIEAITHVRGPAMVLAGPGSGKTFVITQRIRFLIENAHIDPGEILVITFTKAAALEMQQRFYKNTNRRFPEVHFGTFHSVFYQMLCQSKRSYHPQLLNAKEKRTLIGQSLSKVLQLHKEELLQKEEYTRVSSDDYELLLAQVSRIKNEGGEFDVAGAGEEIPFADYFEEIYEDYTSSCRELGRIDFDDMIMECFRMLSSNPAILQKWQSVFSFVLIDEYQDINRLQEKIIRLLVRDHSNIFVVGDDDQSIYGFRGSKPEIMQEFVQFYENAHTIRLSINYRSGQCIVEEALHVIEENKVRFPKSMEAASLDHKGEVCGTVYDSMQEKNARIAERIKEIAEKRFWEAQNKRRAAKKPIYTADVNENRNDMSAEKHENENNMSAEKHESENNILVEEYENEKNILAEKFENKNDISAEKNKNNLPAEIYDDIAVLCRTNAQLEPIVLALSMEGIPYVTAAAVTSIYEHVQVKQLMAYLSYAVSGQKREDFYMLMNHPLRYIKREAVRHEKVNEADVLRFYRQNPSMYRTLESLFRQLHLLSNMRSALAVRFLLKEAGMEKYMLENKSSVDRARMEAMIDQIMADAAAYPDSRQFLKMTQEQRQRMMEERSRKKGNESHGVRLMTMHASKGLEFDSVFLPGINEGSVPNRRSITKEQIEEERRMFYVGMTRAKEHLMISYVSGDEDNPRMASGFLRPILHIFPKQSM